jgi:hypothetical protein
MKRFLSATTFSFMVLLLLGGLLSAGPLDRQNVQPRANPVTQSMIRVPGVVGQEQAPAMAAIQQAGLNVSVREAKKIPKGMGGAAGMEGKVVGQTPTAGGMAMYGSSVTIQVWKPGQGAAAGSSTGGSNWGTGSTPTYSTQPAYGNPSTTMPAQMGTYPQGGGYGAPQTQGSQPFQVQQYYYPSGSGAGTSTPAGDQTSAPPPATDPYTGMQGTAPPPLP